MFSYPCQVCTIHTTVQSWHQDVAVRGGDVRWVGDQTAGLNIMHALEETAVVDLQAREHRIQVRKLVFACLHILQRLTVNDNNCCFKKWQFSLLSQV